MAAFERVPGVLRQYRNTATNEVISRRQYLKTLRAGLSNEKFAQLNAITNEELSVSRPARGRKSLLKTGEVERHQIAQARIEDKKRREELAIEAKKERELNKLLKKRSSKKPVKRKHVTGRLLKAGRKGARVPFDSYEDYVEMFKEAVRGGKVMFYGLGMEGYHENTGKELDITVFTMRTFTRPIPEAEFYSHMEDALEEHSYFVFTNYWMHLAFKEEYAKQKAEKAKAKGKRK